MSADQRLCYFICFAQQVPALFWSGLIGKPPQVALRPLHIIEREANQCEPATLAPILLRIAPLALFVRFERPTIIALKEPCVTEVVVTKHEARGELHHAHQRSLR